MPSTYFSHWWVWTIRGVLAILFGLLTFVVPTATVAVLVILFGIWALVDGITHLSLAFRQGTAHRGLHTVEGIIGVAAGLIAIFYPLTTGIALLYVIAAWAVLTGVARILLALRLHGTPSREWMIALSGALAVIFGVIILLFPIVGIVAVALWIGIYAIIAGIAFLGISMRMRRSQQGFLASGTTI